MIRLMGLFLLLVLIIATVPGDTTASCITEDGNPKVYEKIYKIHKRKRAKKIKEANGRGIHKARK